MDHEVTKLARMGHWAKLLPMLRATPDWINLASESKGYSSLHQAAWHGADLAVIGQLLRMGADVSLKTKNNGQTAYNIARDKHPERDDLHFLLTPHRSLAQLMRKIMHDNEHLFPEYNDRRVIFDAMVSCFQSNVFHLDDDVDLEMRFAAVYQAVTTLPLHNEEDFRLYCPPSAPVAQI